MSKASQFKMLSVLGVAALVVGCAEVPSAKWEQSTPFCVAAGALAGGAVAQAADNQGAAGALVGAGVAYLICHKEPVCEANEIKTGKGCELDSDQDGIVNRADQCPGTPARAPVDGRGCQLDSDADGVVNVLDQCPETPAGVEVDPAGCPADEDLDGVANANDICPATPVGVSVDLSGCPAVDKLSLEGVNFEYKSSRLTSEAKAILDNVAEVLSASSSKFTVEGHTDSVGSASYNKNLSQARADSVMAYLASKGISTERMNAIGYGESSPVATNDTEAGRAVNRRVALVPVI
ncbi:OmpA family protein [Neptunomonas phycophila]|jgi:OOP family OmpA-OmpF porin|uniref:OmpA family protein n=2 Tax=Neptunomonas phycophila TaxID=1572645 RepID=A0AAW7XIG1_9GAMM|nr:OmpA family protein [Neptunomonas phycophila]MBT3146848.1 OmpA family protein [Neptunomonas phycophila]MDO6452640.1 OmpA family protein [Neptunomonas phycophila]MDO6783693.1 OmpA family protein [Neptunomonas phycophila]